MKRAINIIYTTMMLVLLLGCKKYPENYLIGAPETTLNDLTGNSQRCRFSITTPAPSYCEPKGAMLNKILINGIDSTFKYKNTILFYRSEESASNKSSSSNSSIKTQYPLPGWYHYVGYLFFSRDKKYILIGRSWNRGDYKWKIIKLTRHELKIETTINNIHYEMHFVRNS
ncbi:MAG: hypothetical protein Fur0023_18140 [Bacteroidia bacterium]